MSDDQRKSRKEPNRSKEAELEAAELALDRRSDTVPFGNDSEHDHSIS